MPPCHFSPEWCERIGRLHTKHVSWAGGGSGAGSWAAAAEVGEAEEVGAEDDMAGWGTRRTRAGGPKMAQKQRIHDTMKLAN